MFDRVYDMSAPVYAVVNEFDLAGHMSRMAAKHPQWSDRQLRCVLYWQGTARKQLRIKVAEALKGLPWYTDTWCPEGMGVNVTATMEAVGVTLEWPPEQIVRQVAFLGFPFSNLRF